MTEAEAARLEGWERGLRFAARIARHYSEQAARAIEKTADNEGSWHKVLPPPEQPGDWLD